MLGVTCGRAFRSIFARASQKDAAAIANADKLR